MSKTAELRKLVKAILEEQGGKFYGYNYCVFYKLGYNGTDIQNAINYFQYSPQQKKFREAVGM